MTANFKGKSVLQPVGPLEKICFLTPFINLKNRYYCVNTIKAFKIFTRFQCARLKHLESYFTIPRKYDLYYKEINILWNSGKKYKKKIVLDYNKDDCINLWRMVRLLIRDYGVTRSDLRSIAM